MTIQKRYLPFTIIFIFSLLLSILYSCSEANLKSRIIGKWVNENNSAEFLEFLKDGTVIGRESHAGNYKFIDEKRLKMDFGSETIVAEVSFDKEGQLNLKNPAGNNVAIFITEAMAKKRQEAKPYIKSGLDNFNKGNYDKAVEDYSKAIAINPNIADAYVNRGLAYSRSGKIDNAIEDYNKAIAMNPNLPFAYYTIAASYSLLGKETAACDSLNKVIEKGFKDLIISGMDNPDFDKIRNSSCFKKIVSRIKR